MIRPAVAADLPALVELNHEVHRLHVAAAPGRYRDPSREQISAALTAVLADDAAAVLVAEQDGAVVGYLVVRQVDSPGHVYAPPRRTAHVDQLGVGAGAQRCGHGRALMAAAEAQARRWGATGITLDVQAFNQAALAFYQAIGYRLATSRLERRLS